MVSTIEVIVLVTITVLTLFVGWRLYVNLNWYNTNSSKSLYRTAVANGNTAANNPLNFSSRNLSKGTDLKLDCPDGYKVIINSVYINGMPAPGPNDYDPNRDPNYDYNKCWKALSNMGPGYPQSGEQNKETTYIKAIRSLKAKYDGKSSLTIPSDDSDIVSLVNQYLISSTSSRYADSSAESLSECDVSFLTSNNDMSPWTPLVVCLYECQPI